MTDTWGINSPIITRIPPIGVFWDIENCHVPKNKSAFDFAVYIREKYFKGHRETEFMCVCDVSKESKEVVNELNDAQVVVVHIDAQSKNSADFKLRQCMQKFADIHEPPATIILISGDTNFAPDLSDLRYRRQFTIILIHNGLANESLLACANETVAISELASLLPNRQVKKKLHKHLCELKISNLPTNQSIENIHNRLERLSKNCGGKAVSIYGSNAIMKFSSPDITQRALKRMDKEDVFGNKISVQFNSPYEERDKGNLTTYKEREHSLPQPNFYEYFRPNSNPLIYDVLSPISSNTTSSLLQEESVNFGENTISEMFNPPSLRHTDSNGVESKLDHYNGHDPYNWMTSGKREESNFRYFWDKESPVTNGATHKDHSDGTRQFKGAEKSNGVSTFATKARSLSNQKDVSLNRGWMSGSSTGSRRNTPSPLYDSAGMGSSSLNVGAPFENSNGGYNDGEPIELQITNLDPNMDIKQLKQHLQALFREHVMVLHVHVSLNLDGNISAGVKVSSMNDAQFAISKLHRTRLGSKRINISIASNTDPIPLSVLRSEVIALLLDVPGKRLALFKFRELYEKRYHRSIGVSELHRLKDAISIQESANGKTVLLNHDFRRNTPSPACSDGSKEVQEILEMAHCELHYLEDDGKGWAEKEQANQLPSVMISLNTLVANVHSLLQLHGNGIPLNSFPTCYQCVFGELEVIETGVPLEHLVTIVTGVSISRNSNGIKILDWSNDKADFAGEPRSVSPPLANQLSLLCREIVDLLKNQTQCRIPFTKFIPAYHHHFGRQCRVADYGYTRLLDLLDAIPHVVQILGDGNKRILTLTHRAQMKRFNADLLRILKSQASKEVSLKEFPDIYFKCIGKEFNIVNYGMCDILDMLSQVTEGVILVTGEGDNIKIQIPKREQSSEEAERTKQFKLEAMELLRNSPRCRMGFTKFIPSYHHHFSRQCRVADYGFSKLIELFEAIPDVVEVKPSDEAGEDRILQLAQPQLLEVFSDQIISLMRISGRQIMTLEKLVKAYIQQNGYSIYPEDYNATDVVDLLEKLRTVKVTETPGGCLVTLVERNHNFHIAYCVKKILLSRPDGKMKVSDFCRILAEEYDYKYDIQQMLSSVGSLIQVEGYGEKVRIDAMQLFMRDVVQLLHLNGGRLLLAQFNEAFINLHKRPCVPTQYGYHSLASLLQSIHEVAIFKGRSTKRALVLNMDNPNLLNLFGEEIPNTNPSKIALPKINTNSLAPVRMESSKQQVVDLMNDPIPLRIPSPSLRPQPVIQSSQLINFESPLSDDKRNGFDCLSSISNNHETLCLDTLRKREQESFGHAFMPSLGVLPLFQTCFSPASSSLPPIPCSWKPQSLATISPPNGFPNCGAPEDVVPGTPTTNTNDFSDLVMSTPPFIRQLISNSSPENTPIKSSSSSNDELNRVAAQFSTPITRSSKSTVFQLNL